VSRADLPKRPLARRLQARAMRVTNVPMRAVPGAAVQYGFRVARWHLRSGP
jgi:hypothetical protein